MPDRGFTLGSSTLPALAARVLALELCLEWFVGELVSTAGDDVDITGDVSDERVTDDAEDGNEATVDDDDDDDGMTTDPEDDECDGEMAAAG